MLEGNSTIPANSGKPIKPAKPYPDFPLGYHPAGYWCKKIKGKLHYFGPRFDPSDPDATATAADAALADYNRQADALHSGRTPRPDPETIRVKDIANHFLIAKQEAVDAGELSPRTWADYRSIMNMMVDGMGKQRAATTLDPQDFADLKNKLAKKNGPARMSTIVQVIRCGFKHAYDTGMLDRPMRFGPAFKRTSKKTMRLHKAKQGPKLFSADEVRRLLKAATQPLKAMLYLAINCGYGNGDCGQLQRFVVDLENGIIDYPRPKTGIARRCVLWPETIQAIREALAERPEPKKEEHAGLVFITRCGQPWDKGTSANPVSEETKKLLRKLGINGRQGLGFYTLRHTFRTVADEAKDQPAADYIMGHEVAHMSSVYRESISDARLKAVADHVRQWLFPPAKEEKAV